MYAWMTHPVVEALGAEWLERGAFETRFAKPIYYEEPATIRARVSARTAEAITIEVAAHNSVGEVCGTATMSLDRSGRARRRPWSPTTRWRPLPAERPRATRAHLEGLDACSARPSSISTPRRPPDSSHDLGETLAVYWGRSAPPIRACISTWPIAPSTATCA